MGRAPHDGTPDVRRRKNRPRPTPKWLLRDPEVDATAKARCLLVLSVLSGEKPVSDAVAEVKMSRAAYYQLETKALNAMLSALSPLSNGETTPDLAAPARRIAELEAKVQRLEQAKRRAERLLHMTRKVLRPRALTNPKRGRPRKDTHSSTTSGSNPSRNSKKKDPSNVSLSTPTKAGAVEP